MHEMLINCVQNIKIFAMTSVKKFRERLISRIPHLSNFANIKVLLTSFLTYSVMFMDVILDANGQSGTGLGPKLRHRLEFTARIKYYLFKMFTIFF